ncbi:flagellar biosynthesis protein FlhF, partial [Bordetella hinzii]
MKIHRFTGPNTRDVMRQVREVLGEDALIISNRTVEQGIEVLAALESEMQAAPAPAEPRPAPPPPEPPRVQPLPPVPPSDRKAS